MPRIFEAYSSLLGVRCKMLDLRYTGQKHGVYFVLVPNMSSCLARTATSRALCRIKTSLTSLKTASGTLVTSANPTVAAAGKHERGGMPEPQTREPDELARSSGSSGASGSRPGPPAASEHQRRLEKKALRASIKAALKSLSQEQKRSESARVCSTILEDLRLIDDLPATAGVGIYLACETLNEVDAGRILQRAFERGLRVYLPRVLDRDSNMHFLRVHEHDTYDVVPPFGIREPSLADTGTGKVREDVMDGRGSLDVIFMPGLGFGDGGERLGRGGGYYDAFIARYMDGGDAPGEGGTGEKAGEAGKAETDKGTGSGRAKPLLVGLAFDAQVVNGSDVPMDPHDQYLDIVVSGTRVFAKR